jgi:choline kinase
MINVVIPMAGAGHRFTEKGYMFKPFIKVVKESMIREVVDNLNSPDFRFIFIINTEQVSVQDFVEHIHGKCKDYLVVTTESLTEGPACSALLAKDYINNSTPLIIVNCDQIIKDFEPNFLKEFVESTNCDGFLGCFLSSSKKNSYLKVDPNGEVVELREKVVISNLATNGLHYWKEGKFFVDSAEEMIAKEDRYNNEFYIAPSYNYLIKQGKKILPYFFNLHFPIGTPEDLDLFKSQANLR